MGIKHKGLKGAIVATSPQRWARKGIRRFLGFGKPEKGEIRLKWDGSELFDKDTLKGIGVPGHGQKLALEKILEDDKTYLISKKDEFVVHVCNVRYGVDIECEWGRVDELRVSTAHEPSESLYYKVAEMVDQQRRKRGKRLDEGFGIINRKIVLAD